MNLLFGAGDSDHPLWLLAVRLNILVFLALLIALFAVSIVPWKPRLRTVLLPVTLTLLAAALRFGLALPNIFDHGGVTYSRMLAGYRGYFAVAQLYSPLYRLFGRTVERAILFNRLASTLTIPVLYSLGRKLAPDRALGPLAALLLATSPLTVQLAASTELTPMSLLLAASSYLLFIESWNELSARQGRLCWLAALAGLALLTQVRYENLLFLLPPALWAIARRPPRWTVFQSISLSLFALLIGSYVGAAIAAGPEHNPVDVPAGIRAARAVLASPFTLAPLLLAATVFTAVRRRGSWGLYTLLPWLAVTLLIVYTSPRPHHAARVFANWMLLFALIA